MVPSDIADSATPSAIEVALSGGFSASTDKQPREDTRLLSFDESRSIPWILIAVDTLVLEGCLGIGFGIRFLLDGWFPYDFHISTVTGLASGVLILPVVLFLSGLYPGYGLNDIERLRRVVTMTAVVFSCLIAWDYIVQQGQWSRGVLLGTWAVTTLLLPITFFVLRAALVRARIWGTPLIIIGTGEDAERLILRLTESPKLGYVPAGILAVEHAEVGSSIADVPVLDTLKTAPFWARTVKTAAVALSDLDGAQTAAISAKLPFPNVVILPDYLGLQATWVTPRDLAGELGLEIKKNLLLRRNRMLKRTIDVAGASVLLVAFLPLLAVASLTIMVVSPGWPLYQHVVAGRGTRPFKMLKLRTMHPNAKDRLERYLDEHPEKRAEWLKFLKLRDDPRVIPCVGNLLRKSSIDELPQILNVLRGDMSLVGPRPLAVYELDVVDESYVTLRCSVTPGVTGLWQVEGRSDGGLESRVKLDTYYIRNWSIWLDIYILFKTIPSVLSGRGAY